MRESGNGRAQGAQGTMQGIASAISARRKKVGISGSELGRRAGITHAYVSKIEAGLAKPSLGVLERLASALDTDLAGLIEDSSLNQELARRLPTVIDVREQAIRSLLSLPDEDMKRGLLQLIDRVHRDED